MTKTDPIIIHQLYNWCNRWNMSYYERQPLLADLKELKTKHPTINFKRLLLTNGWYVSSMDTAIKYVGERV